MHVRVGARTDLLHPDLQLIPDHRVHRTAEVQVIEDLQGPVIQGVPDIEVLAEAHREVQDIEVPVEAHREVQDTEVPEVDPEVQVVSVVLVVHSDLPVVVDQAVVAVPEEEEEDNNSITFILI